MENSTGRLSTAVASAAWQRPFMAVWRALGHPVPLLLVAGAVALYLLAALLLPQLPGQYVDSPAQALRWSLETQSRFGTWGEILGALGLFRVLHSVGFRLLLAVLTLLLWVHLGDGVARWQRLRLLGRLLETPVDGPGAPLPIPGPGPIHRVRWVAPGAPSSPEIVDRCLADLASGERRLDRFLRRRETTGDTERRWLLHSPPWWGLLWALVPGGVLLALAGVWLAVSVGWSFQVADLAPGDEVRFPRRDVTVRYPMPRLGEAGTALPQVEVEVAGSQGLFPLGERPRGALNGVEVTVDPGAPGLVLATVDGAPRLRLPGNPQPMAQLAFVFPTQAHEQAILLPEAGVGIRIVRLEGTPSRFLVQAVDGQTLEVLAQDEVVDRAQVAIPGDAGGSEIRLQVHTVAGLDVTVRYWPGRWLTWLGLALALVGLAALWLRPFFLLLQWSPWPGERSVWVAQSDHPHRLAQLLSCLHADSGAEEG